MWQVQVYSKSPLLMVPWYPIFWPCLGESSGSMFLVFVCLCFSFYCCSFAWACMCVVCTCACERPHVCGGTCEHSETIAIFLMRVQALCRFWQFLSRPRFSPNNSWVLIVPDQKRIMSLLRGEEGLLTPSQLGGRGRGSWS